ncbi:hypothetical protein ACKKBG_A30595 [Auxenochlorella protothecoides x Auxenochlorella symbiontica]
MSAFMLTSINGYVLPKVSMCSALRCDSCPQLNRNSRASWWGRGRTHGQAVTKVPASDPDRLPFPDFSVPGEAEPAKPSTQPPEPDNPMPEVPPNHPKKEEPAQPTETPEPETPSQPKRPPLEVPHPQPPPDFPGTRPPSEMPTPPPMEAPAPPRTPELQPGQGAPPEISFPV